MIAKHTLRVFALLSAMVFVTAAAEALAQCATCGVPAATYQSVAYQPVAYSAAYAPVAYQTYRPYSSWYPGYWVDRVNRSVWGYPTTTYAAYYPATYTAGYATTSYYAPSYSYASYAPACSTCGTCSTCSYAPACNTCSTCSVSYAPACTTCSTCDACTGCATCSSCASGTPVSQAVYQEPAASSTYSTPSASSAPATMERQPTLAPAENPPAERTYQQSEKPLPAEPPTLDPQPLDDQADDSAMQAPQLFDPNDRTAQAHSAPVWTAVYHKSAASAQPTAQNISWQQARLDAEGWTSASE